MNPVDLIFGAISDLTGGLITDLTTVVIGLLTISFIAMGADLIISALASSYADSKRTGRVRSTFEELQKARESGSEVERDMAKSRYNDALRRYGRGK